MKSKNKRGDVELVNDAGQPVCSQPGSLLSVSIVGFILLEETGMQLHRFVAGCSLSLMVCACGFETTVAPSEAGQDGTGDTRARHREHAMEESSRRTTGPVHSPSRGHRRQAAPGVPGPGAPGEETRHDRAMGPAFEDCEDGVAHGALQSRTRFAVDVVPTGERCPSEVQTRRCLDGKLEPWSGDFAFETCTVSRGAIDADPAVEPKPTWESTCEHAGATEPFAPRPEETCWEFRAHNASSPTDDTPLELSTGEAYHELYYAVPWPAGSVASRVRTEWDADAMYFQTTFASDTGRHNPGDVMRNVLGSTLGQHTTVLATGGAGGCNQELPPDVGLELPDDGLIMVQWHVYNDTGDPLTDRSAVHICTVPGQQREHTASWALLGTEQLGGLPGFEPGEHEFSGTCSNDSDQPITLVWLRPHLRAYGRRVTTVWKSQGGASVPVLDTAFDVAHQVTYALSPRVELAPGDSLETTCAFDNTSASMVGLGQSAHTEICYQLTLSYPAGLLQNGALSVSSARNTCW
ncbi:MAG: hypothetical protein OXR73_19020 [Myxococcales bacterium]|nr:hypothetical protein [Myxococcales bacterium]